MSYPTQTVEPHANISAPDLLKNTPMLFGWVRKEETAGLRSMVKVFEWPWRYMILSKGCLYLYKHSDDQNFCEAIPLTKFRVCNAPEKSKYPWVFKLIHTESYDVSKTVVFAVDTDFDLKKWQDAISKDMEEYCCDSSREEDTDGYCSIDDNVVAKAPGPPPRVQTVRNRPPAPIPVTRRPYSFSFPAEPPQKPLPLPPRQERSEFARLPTSEPKPLILPRPQVTPKPTKPSTMGRLQKSSSESASLSNMGYDNVVNQLQNTKLGSADKRGVASTLPPSSKVGSAAHYKPAKLGRGAPDGQSFKAKNKEGVLPSSALRLDIDKTQVNSLLENKPGVYILRESKTAQSKMALSVCTGDRIRHYVLFYEEHLGYALHPEGARFDKIDELLRHYHDFNLPNCEVKLTRPCR